MKVIKNVTGLSESGETVDITYYTGDSLAQAISALAVAASEVERTDTFYRVNSVRLEV